MYGKASYSVEWLMLFAIFVTEALTWHRGVFHTIVDMRTNFSVRSSPVAP